MLRLTRLRHDLMSRDALQRYGDSPTRKIMLSPQTRSPTDGDRSNCRCLGDRLGAVDRARTGCGTGFRRRKHCVAWARSRPAALASLVQHDGYAVSAIHSGW
jgi:hypothetical protein